MTERSSTELSDELKSAVKENINRIRNAIAGKNVTFMAATKTVCPELINYATEECGLTDIGENRVQELRDKYDSLRLDKMNIHFIGSLQPNKVKYLIGKVCLIHSLDSYKLAEEISKRSTAAGTVTDALCEVNIGLEAGKGGVAPDCVRDLILRSSELNGIRIRGLMMIGPHCESENGYIPFFQQTKELFDKLNSEGLFGSDPILSMGMSDNYELAIRYGSTLIRPGTAVFGKR